MYYIDQDACTGCKICVKRCPEKAISVVAGKASIATEKCTECGECARLCPFGAVHNDSETVAHPPSKEQPQPWPDPRFGNWPE
jgi:ferredoxin